MRNVPGVVEVNSIGGYEKQYHVTPDRNGSLVMDWVSASDGRADAATMRMSAPVTSSGTANNI